jgi:hypothetical protein
MGTEQKTQTTCRGQGIHQFTGKGDTTTKNGKQVQVNHIALDSASVTLALIHVGIDLVINIDRDNHGRRHRCITVYRYNRQVIAIG